MSAADRLLGALNKVKPTGPGRWLACCPAHEDKRPSLSIRELDDGRLLLHCWASCEASAVLAAVGLEFADLFPEPIASHAPRVRRPFLPADVFEVVRLEVGVIAIIAADMHKSMAVTDGSRARLFTAAARLDEIARAAYGR
jgi:hypothetical protein